MATKKEEFSINADLHNKLVDKFQERAKTQGYKGKQLQLLQAEFFLGACVGLDILHGNKKTTCATPMIVFSIMRGDLIKKIKP